ncbi:hypothetical protein D1007_54241 [Hordeum vulgare]|nr:hypothetical protein D1007_54241 [Hordeum vulgare]
MVTIQEVASGDERFILNFSTEEDWRFALKAQSWHFKRGGIIFIEFDDKGNPAEVNLGVMPISVQLPNECDWVVWIDPPPSYSLCWACFDDLHAALEHNSMKASNLERWVMDLTIKNKKLKQNNELMETMCFVIVLGISIVASLVSMWSN